MHVWVVEVKRNKNSNWETWWLSHTRYAARLDYKILKAENYDARVVKYISSKGE